MTRQEVIDKLITRLVQVRYQEIDWTLLVQAVGNSGQAGKDALIDAIKTKDSMALANIMFVLINAKILADATTEADAMMTDDTLVLADLIRIYTGT